MHFGWVSDTEQQFIEIELTFEKEKNLHEIHSKSALVQPSHATSFLKSTNRVDNDARRKQQSYLWQSSESNQL